MKVVVALTTTPVTIHVQVSPELMIPSFKVSPLTKYWDALRRVRGIVGIVVPGVLVNTTFGDEMSPIPELCSVIIRLSVPPPETEGDDGVMVTVVLGLMIVKGIVALPVTGPIVVELNVALNAAFAVAVVTPELRAKTTFCTGKETVIPPAAKLNGAETYVGTETGKPFGPGG